MKHSFRVYHQMQSWLGNSVDPENWGWHNQYGELMPILTSKPAAPEHLLNLISCNCKCGCESACGCKKVGLYCTVLCGNCHGNGCTNTTPANIEDSDAEETVNTAD